MRQTKRARINAMDEDCKAKTDALVIGETYFLSSFYDKDGAWVTVLDKSHARNAAGWSSTVTVAVIKPEGDSAGRAYYGFGTVHTVNASNLYAKREDASHAATMARFDAARERKQ